MGADTTTCLAHARLAFGTTTEWAASLADTEVASAAGSFAAGSLWSATRNTVLADLRKFGIKTVDAAVLDVAIFHVPLCHCGCGCGAADGSALTAAADGATASR